MAIKIKGDTVIHDNETLELHGHSNAHEIQGTVMLTSNHTIELGGNPAANLVIGDLTGFNIAFDDHGIQSRLNTTSMNLDINKLGGMTIFGGTVKIPSESHLFNGYNYGNTAGDVNFFAGSTQKRAMGIDEPKEWDVGSHSIVHPANFVTLPKVPKFGIYFKDIYNATPNGYFDTAVNYEGLAGPYNQNQFLEDWSVGAVMDQYNRVVVRHPGYYQIDAQVALKNTYSGNNNSVLGLAVHTFGAIDHSNAKRSILLNEDYADGLEANRIKTIRVSGIMMIEKNAGIGMRVHVDDTYWYPQFQRTMTGISGGTGTETYHPTYLTAHYLGPGGDDEVGDESSYSSSHEA